MITRKGFKLIAAALYSARFTMRRPDHTDVCLRIANALSGSNPRFDRSRFLAACGCDGYHE